MEILCPHCLSRVTLVADGSTPSVRCPACNQEFTVKGSNEETKTFAAVPAGQLGRFELLNVLGAGGFGTVYRGFDSQLKRFVAVKTPRHEQVNTNHLRRMLREAEAAARLKHPAIVQVYEVGEDGGRFFIVSELVDGMPLTIWMRRHSLSPLQAASLCREIAEGLQHAHQMGIVHRDLKPSNIMMDAHGRPKILDFGLAKFDGGDDSITAQGEVVGTLAYMSPQQARGDAAQIDGRTDVYALGVILYEMLTGRRPFQATDGPATLYRIVYEDPVPPHQVRSQVPRALEAICLKAMAKLPAARYATAQEMADDLARFVDGRPVRADSALAVPSATLSRRRIGVIMFVGTLLLLMLALWGTIRPAALEPIRHAAAVAGQENAGRPPTARPEYLVDRRVLIEIRTAPAAARLVLVPFQADKGQLEIDRRVRVNGPTPCLERVLPGTYLVEAVLPDGSFHRVYRRVPEPNEQPDPQYRHQHWTETGAAPRRVVWPTIEILPTADVTRDMTYFAGQTFTMGSRLWPAYIPTRVSRVADFLLDRQEVTRAEFRRVMGRLPAELAADEGPAKEDFPVTQVSYDDCLEYAERVGKTLMTEEQYEFAATNGGQTLFPWGNSHQVPAKFEFGPVGHPEFDRNWSNPPVVGLGTNVAEWTDSVLTMHSERMAREAPREFAAIQALAVKTRVIRGGGNWVALRKAPEELPQLLLVSWREGRDRDKRLPGLGFRCAKDVRPRWVDNNLVAERLPPRGSLGIAQLRP